MIRLVFTSAAIALAGLSSAAIATFDTLVEGSSGASLTDGGITFSNLDRFFGTGAGESFAIDDASADLSSFAGYSSPNVLAFGGYSPGTGVAFSRFGSMDFTTGSAASSASMEIFGFGQDAGTTLTLQGLNGTTVVNSASITLPTQFTIFHSTLTLGTGNYTSFHVISNSPTNQGASFVSMDNITVNPVPEPATLTVLSLSSLALLKKRKRR